MISRTRLLGRETALIKTLPTFDKKRHLLPTAHNPATQAFLTKLITPNLTEESEQLYQSARASLSYKRTQLILDLAPPTATLTSPDFTHELTYELSPETPSEYILTRTLHTLNNPNLLDDASFNTLFASSFHSLIIDLSKPIQIETLIDAIESLADTPIRVSYPSHCRSCLLEVDKIPAQVHCTPDSLEMRFPSTLPPKDLIANFHLLKTHFDFTQSPTLTTLLS